MKGLTAVKNMPLAETSGELVPVESVNNRYCPEEAFPLRVDEKSSGLTPSAELAGKEM